MQKNMHACCPAPRRPQDHSGGVPCCVHHLVRVVARCQPGALLGAQELGCCWRFCKGIPQPQAKRDGRQPLSQEQPLPAVLQAARGSTWGTARIRWSQAGHCVGPQCMTSASKDSPGPGCRPSPAMLPQEAHQTPMRTRQVSHQIAARGNVTLTAGTSADMRTSLLCSRQLEGGWCVPQASVHAPG